MKTLVVSQLNRKFAAKTIIMKSYGRKSMLKFSMFLKQSKYPRWSLSFPEVGEEANYFLVVFRGTKIVILSETA